MKNISLKGAELVIEYSDPLEGFKGWLAVDSLREPLAAGGMRVQQGLTREHIINMARNMSRKMRVCGLPIAGAKCGIDYPAAAPGKLAAMTRFMAAIRPYIEQRYSMGPDLNTDMDELEAAARSLGLPAIKMAIAQSQGMDIPYFLERYAILSHEVRPGWTLGKLRAGHGVAAAALATLKHLDIPPQKARVAVQGFGNLAKAAIMGLLDAGVKICAIADVERCLLINHNDIVERLLQGRGTLLPQIDPDPDLKVVGSSSIVNVECDLLVLAAIENAITEENMGALHAKAVVPGANLAVSSEAEDRLHARGVPVLPCFLAGCGGSLSMNGLFAPKEHPQAQEVLEYVARTMKEICQQTLKRAQQDGSSVREALDLICRKKEIPRRERPYSF